MGSAALSTTVNGNFLVGTAGAVTVRVRASVWTSGEAVIYMEGTSAPAGVFLSRSIPTGVNAIGTVGVTDVTTGTITADDGGGSITVDGTVTGDTELAAAAAAADDAANPTIPQVGALNSLYNSTTVDSSWDRERNNWSEWPFPNDCYTYEAPVTGETVKMTNYNAKGAYIVVNITGIGAGQTLTVKGYINDYDGAGAEASDQMECIWASAALTPTGRHTYIIYPGVGAAAQDVVATVSYPLPRLWAIGVTVVNNEPITFSIGVHYIN